MIFHQLKTNCDEIKHWLTNIQLKLSYITNNIHYVWHLEIAINRYYNYIILL